jgi:hypothetical protein
MSIDRARLDELQAMPDSVVDTSEICEANEAFFNEAALRAKFPHGTFCDPNAGRAWEPLVGPISFVLIYGVALPMFALGWLATLPCYLKPGFWKPEATDNRDAALRLLVGAAASVLLLLAFGIWRIFFN